MSNHSQPDRHENNSATSPSPSPVMDPEKPRSRRSLWVTAAIIAGMLVCFAVGYFLIESASAPTAP